MTANRYAATRFGEKLRTLRKTRGWSQQMVADRCRQFGRTEVSNIERGERAPTVEFVLWVRDRFGVSLDELLLDDVELSSDMAAT